MKPVGHPKYFLLLLLLAFGLSWSPALRAAPDETTEPKQETPPAAPAAPAAPTEVEQPAAPAEPAGKPAAEERSDDDMRELVPADDNKAAVKADDAKPDSGKKSSRRTHRSGSERVSVGSNSTLAAGESAEAVISIIGSSTSAGEVHDAVVSILGSSRVTGGTVGDSVVSVIGNTYINGEVKGEVVTVLGNVELGPDAVVHGEVICIGGQLERHPDAVVRGQVQNIAVAGGHYDFNKIGAWFTECLLQGRMLAFDARLMWAWTIALVALGFYALIALIAPAGVNKCVETLEQRPGSSLLAALLTLLLTPVVYILMALTIAIAIGIVLIPLFSLGLFFAALFGKIVMLAWLGRRFTKLLGDGPLAHPVFGVLIGGVIVLALYATPYVGIIFYKLIGILGLGVVVYTLILMAKASRPPKPAVAAAAASATASAGVAVVAPAAAPLEGTAATPPPVSAAPPVISAATLPRAGFWIRVGAAFLDFILVFVALAILLDGVLNINVRPGALFLLWIAYQPIMWKMKGTTIGGIICGLKVTRLDDRPIDWTIAIVRALTGFLSFIAFGLGFIWVAFDDEKQSWHDKVAGTTIVKVPKGTPLL